MAEGYIGRGKPDVAYWTDQMVMAQEYRKEVAFEDKWDDWHKFSRGEWRDGILPVNLFFTMMRTIVPRVYFRNPSVSITSAKPGPLFMGFAKLLERTNAKLMRQMRLKDEMKKMVQNAFLRGTGIGTLGFGAEYEYEHSGYVQAPMIGGDQEAIEYRDHVVPHMPWFASVSPRDYMVPAGCDSMKTARWTGMFVERPVEDVRKDPRLSRTMRRQVGEGSFRLDRMKHQHNSSKQQFARRGRRAETVEMAVLRDKKTHQVIVLAPSTGSNKSLLLYHGHDALQESGFPDFSLVFNPDTDYFWGVPDSQILEPYQLEINEVRTQVMKHRRLALVKFLVQKGTVDAGEIQKLVSEDVASIVNVNTNPSNSVLQTQAASIPDDLFAVSEQILRDVRDSVGFSRNQFGEFNSQTAETTATEANIVRQASEIRVDERRDAMADLMVDIIEGIHSLIFRKWTHTEVAQVVGPGGVQVWVEFTPQMLAIGQYNVHIDPDNSLPQTKQAREQKAMQLYTVLKDNPLIDPMRLTSYLLHELHGTAFDDMMKAMPNVGQPGRPLNPMEYGDMLREGMNQASPQQLMQGALGANV